MNASTGRMEHDPLLRDERGSLASGCFCGAASAAAIMPRGCSRVVKLHASIEPRADRTSGSRREHVVDPPNRAWRCTGDDAHWHRPGAGGRHQSLPHRRPSGVRPRVHAEERRQAGVPLQVRVCDRRDCAKVCLRRFRGSLDCSALSEPRRRTRRRVPRSAAGARNGEALSANPGRGDEGLRRAALARARRLRRRSIAPAAHLSGVVLDGAETLIIVRRSSRLRSTPARRAWLPFLTQRSPRLFAFWNSRRAVPCSARKSVSRERCIFPGTGIKFKRRCAGVLQTLLCAAYPNMRSTNQHVKEEIQMASKRTYNWGILFGLVALPGLALANPEVIKLTQDSKNWAMQAGNMQNHRYSALKQISTENVKDLRVAWTFSTGVLRGHEGGPLVIGDMLYIHSPFPNKVFAIALADQTIKWKYEPRQDPTVIPVMCCDTVNRGLAYAGGKIF